MFFVDDDVLIVHERVGDADEFKGAFGVVFWEDDFFNAVFAGVYFAVCKPGNEFAELVAGEEVPIVRVCGVKGSFGCARNENRFVCSGKVDERVLLYLQPSFGRYSDGKGRRSFCLGSGCALNFLYPPFGAVSCGDKGVCAVKEVSVGDKGVPKEEDFFDGAVGFFCIIECFELCDRAVFQKDYGAFKIV